MNYSYIIALSLSVITNILFLISILKTNKESIFKLQFAETSINIIKNYLLGGYAGTTMQLLGLIRNGLLAYKINIVGVMYWLPILQICVGLLVNERGFIGLLPVIASSSYTFISFKYDNILILKYALFINILLWTVYEFAIKDYITAVVSIFFIFFISYSIYKLKKNKNLDSTNKLEHKSQ